MSQHMCLSTTSKGEEVTVTLGYDRPLDYIFCTVETDDENFLYSNLDDDGAGIEQQSVDYYRSVLRDLGVHVPESMFREVRADQIGRVGNRVVRHRAG